MFFKVKFGANSQITAQMFIQSTTIKTIASKAFAKNQAWRLSCNQMLHDTFIQKIEVSPL
jgi:hypothetical protein